MKTLDDLDAATDIAAVKETLANMTSKDECGSRDWTTKTKSGWNVFQIAAREGCGDALDNLHMNCVKRGVSTVAQVNRGKWKQPENAVTMEWLVEQKSPDGRNMLHLIAAGWDKLEDHDQPEVASLAKGIINKMSPKQFRVQAPAHGTCVHACAEAGTGAFFRFLLEHGGGDCTQVKCAPDPNPDSHTGQDVRSEDEEDVPQGGAGGEASGKGEGCEDAAGARESRAGYVGG